MNSIRLSLCLVGMVTATPFASAQVTMTLTSGNVWTIGQQVSQPAGTDVTAGVSLSDSFQICDAWGCTSGSGSIDVTPTGNSVQFVANSGGSCGGFGGCAIPTGLAILDLELTSPSPMFVDLSLTAQRSLAAFNATGATIEVPGTTYQLVAPVPPIGQIWGTVNDTITITVGPSGTLLRLTLDPIPGGGGGVCDVSFVATGPAPTITQTPAGSGCGATMTGELLPGVNELGRLRFTVTNSPQWAAPFFVLGASPLGVPIPPTGCVLHTDILVAVPTVLSPLGTAELVVPLPLTLGPTDVRLQYIIGRLEPAGLEWHTSDAIRVQVM